MKSLKLGPSVAGGDILGHPPLIFEMTGGYELVLPRMLENMTSYVVTRRLRSSPTYEALLEQDGVVLPHAAPPAHPPEQLQDRYLLVAFCLA